MAGVIVAFEGWNASGVAWGNQGFGQGVANVSGTGQVGDVRVQVQVRVTGVVGTLSVNDVTVQAFAVVSTTGVTGTGQVGSVVAGKAVYVTGVAGTGSVKSVLIWETLSNEQAPAWVQITN